MVNNDAVLREQAFGERIDASAAVELQSQQEAVKHLRWVLADKRAARVICGPEASGKSTIVRRFVAGLPKDISVAMLDGSRLKPRDLLSEILAQFGYKPELQSVDELLRMVNVFAVQQTRVCQPPVLIVESIDSMYPGALRILCLLAALKFQGRFAIRILLTGSRRAARLLQSEGMAPVAQRAVSVYEVAPFSQSETMRYLHGRLERCGIQQPDQVLPVNVCDRLHEISGGLPGVLNENARGVLALSTKLPVNELTVEKQKQVMRDKEHRLTASRARKISPPTPRLIVTSSGETLQEYEIKEKKVLVGRSNLADVTIYNQFASKMHALFMLYSDALVIVDLNSANGTFVNSTKVSSTILKSDDIISIANHRIKVVNAPESDSDVHDEIRAADTTRMKTLDERREAKKRTYPLFEVDRKTEA